jgi:hypothetical protein
MKKYANRPALRAVDVCRWVGKEIFEIKRIKDTTIFYSTCGKTVRQTWVRKTRRGEIKKLSALTYLRKGIFLTPVWQIVPDWEIKYLQEKQINPRDIGSIFFKRRGYVRLAFRQVEDLDHAIRQQDHIIDNYLSLDFLKVQLPELIDILISHAQIIHKTTLNKVGVESSQVILKNLLLSYQRSLRSILENAPTFRNNNTPKNTEILSNVLAKIVKECRNHKFRPVGRRLEHAARSLERAVIHIQNNRLALAQARIKSALKNLEYPEET